MVRVECDNTCLIRLSDIGENDIDHLNEHSVFLGVSSIFDDRDNVCTLLGHTNEISSGTVREFDGVDDSFGTDDIGNVRDGRSGSGTQV